MSLGVDMVAFKTCSFNCVYCECGETDSLTLERKDYVSADVLINELDLFLKDCTNVDVITFAGSGEPTLNSDLRKVVLHVKNNYPGYKTAILTNSTLLHVSYVRETLLMVDYVLPSIDAMSQNVFEKVNRPSNELSCNMVIDGLREFAKSYEGTLWVEIFIIPGVNDTEEELDLFKSFLLEIKPTRVQINSLDRPGPCSWVTPASVKRLSEIADFFKPLPVEIITRKLTIQNREEDTKQTTELICATLKRRPMTLEDLAISTGKNINEINAVFDYLKKEYTLHIAVVSGRKFYSIL